MEGLTSTKLYFALMIITAGVIDDFQETLLELVRAIRLPISINFINLGNRNRLARAQRLPRTTGAVRREIPRHAGVSVFTSNTVYNYRVG